MTTDSPAAKLPEAVIEIAGTNPRSVRHDFSWGKAGVRHEWLDFPQGGCFAGCAPVVRGRIVVQGTAVRPLDVRVRIDGAVVFGLVGLETAVHGAFDYAVAVVGQKGRHRLSIEVFTAEHLWREVCVEEVVLAHESRPSAAPENKPRAGSLLLHLLGLLQKIPGCDEQLAATVLEQGLDGGMTGLDPALPWRGCLESPSAGRVTVDHWRLSVAGWLAHPKERVESMEAWVHPWLPSKLTHGFARPDVRGVFPDLQAGDSSGFSGEVFVPASIPQPWNLVVAATLTGGTRKLVFARRMWGPSFPDELHDGLPPFSNQGLARARRAVRPVLGGWRAYWTHRASLRKAAQIYREHGAIPDAAGALESVGSGIKEVRGERGTRVLIINDNFRLGGAALFALEYAVFLRREMGWNVCLVAPEPGPLQKLCAQAGLQSEVAGPSPSGPTPKLTAQLYWGESDLVIVNTMVGAWAATAAAAAGKPTVLYVHEGARPERLAGRATTADQIESFKQALQTATRVVYLNRWTMAFHAGGKNRPHHRLLRSWVDLERLDRFAENNPPDVLRRKHNLGDRDFICVCLGEICDRKGQRLLLRALQWLRQEQHPEVGGSIPRVLLVGERDTPDARRLRAECEELALREVHLVPETPQALEYLAMANAYICPSYEEGFPRALMEAAALGKPIIANRIPGVREMLSDAEAWLVPPGDPIALAKAMAAVMRATRADDFRRPAAARRRMERWFDATQNLPVHAALALEALQVGTKTVP